MKAAGPADRSRSVRCFLALRPDAAGVRTLRQSRDVLQPAIAGAARCTRWVEPTGLHLTVRFLGDSGSAQVDYLKHILPTLALALDPIPTRRFGIWPNRARPRLLVLELEPVPPLAELASASELHARKAGFDPEIRRFRAHITLARLRPGCAFDILPAPPPSLTFGSIALMQSTLAPSGATYAELAHATLA